jgi:hypothetical protein
LFNFEKGALKMDRFQKLEHGIIDFITEAQIKLGYQKETFHIYYPLSSLNRLFRVNLDVVAMDDVLTAFCQQLPKELGTVSFARRGDRYRFEIPPEGVEYIYDTTREDDFLVRFVRTISKRGCLIQDLVTVFRTYSNCVVLRRPKCEDFDYLLYFENGVPNDYRYCITKEGEYLTYHRFTAEDFNALNIEL